MPKCYKYSTLVISYQTTPLNNTLEHPAFALSFAPSPLPPRRYLLFGTYVIVLLSGLFFEPTVFTDVEDDMFIADEESFGPVMVISKFKDGYCDSFVCYF